MNASANSTIKTMIESAAHLEWLSRKISKHHIYGTHASRQVGQGLEFEQYRPYIQGDDLRQLDWKLYAKTGKYYIKQSPVSAQDHLHVVIDNSPSMQYREGDYTKLELAKVLCGALHYIAINQGDSFAWTSGSSQWLTSSGHKKWQASIRSLYELEAEQGATSQDSSIVGNLVWISDLYTTAEEMEGIISLNAHHNIAVTVVHIMGRAEEELSFDTSINFKDLETGERIELNPKAFRETYQERLNKHYQTISDLCNSYNTPSIRVYLNEPIDRSLGHIVNHNNAHYR
jgi:uncharacterized protein (DUF58 family)